MKVLGINFSFSMERLWLGSEESLISYLEMQEKFASSIQARMFADDDDDEGAPVRDPSKIGDYLITRNGDTAVLAVKGSLVNGYAAWHPLVAGMLTSYEAIKAAAAQLAAESDIKNVVLDIGSPGGMAVGVQSAAKAIQKLGRHKKVTAHTESMAASAAYWIAASAGKVTASEMAEVGSIGVISMVPDVTKMLENEGIQVHVIKAGKYKGAGSPYKEFTDEDQEYLQGRIDKTNNFFLTHVARRRNLKLSDRAQWADAKVFYAGEAKAVGLIDEVVDLSDLLGGLSATNKSRGKNMEISEEKLAMIAAGASPESVLSAEELTAYNESIEAETAAAAAETEAETADEIAAREAAEAEEAAAQAEVEAAQQALAAGAHELAKENGRLEAKLEASNDKVAALTADLEAAKAQTDALKGVAQAAVTNLQVALRQPKESKDSPADIVAQYTSLKDLMTKRMPVGRQSDARHDTREPDERSRASRVPDPYRPQ